MDSALSSELRLPFAGPPELGEPIEVAPGILWLRLALPYALNHVNLYLFEDGPGWALLDTGIADEPTREIWQRVLADKLGGKPITKLVLTHFHPDHVGMAGWLSERFGMPLYMSQSEYLMSRLLQSGAEATSPAQGAFYRAGGLAEERVAQVLTKGHSYLKRTTGLQPSYTRLIAGERLELGGRSWRIFTGGGHAIEQVMLWCEADRLFLSADQVLARISPNVSVNPMQPQGDPLGLYLQSLNELREAVDGEALVLPCHNLPFYGLHDRARQLEAHHHHRCDLIAAACRTDAKSCAEIVPVIFDRPLFDPHQLSFAVGEAQAHLNYMLRQGTLAVEPDPGHVLRYSTV
ncbi:MAG TPA: MBL fold metallo-hydrolase [Aliidongia sp.]|nr:MBL fold metallo-hydrolase [Aliidongia sp.]